MGFAARVFLVMAAAISSCLPVAPASAFWDPHISALSPALGPNDGGATVTIKGWGFIGVTHVWFGDLPSAAVILSDNQLVTVTPPHAEGVVEVRVSTPFVTSPDAGAADNYRYHYQPKISGVSPDSAFDTGGGAMRISGSGFTGATSVRVGSAAASFTVASDGTINAVLPPKSSVDPSIVNVVVTNKYARSIPMFFDNQDDFRYYPTPRITSVSPDEGPTTGGFKIQITGSGFTDATTVYFGTTEVDAHPNAAGTQITLDAPEMSWGRYELTIANPAGIGPARADDEDTIGFFDASDVEDALLLKISNYRASKSKNRLTTSGSLTQSARAWSAQMIENGVSHDTSRWCPSEFRSCGELIQAEVYDGYMTAASYVEHLFQAFKSSADHNAIMLYTFSHDGAGIVFDRGFGYITVRFGLN